MPLLLKRRCGRTLSAPTRGRFRGLRALRRKSVFYGAFARARRVLNGPRRSPARAAKPGSGEAVSTGRKAASLGTLGARALA